MSRVFETLLTHQKAIAETEQSECPIFCPVIYPKKCRGILDPDILKRLPQIRCARFAEAVFDLNKKLLSLLPLVDSLALVWKQLGVGKHEEIAVFQFRTDGRRLGTFSPASYAQVADCPQA